MRQFWIKNAKGEVFDLNREDAFFSNPRGLGISRKNTYERIGAMWKLNEGYMAQKKISGDMVFDGYEQYEEFMKIAQFTPLTLMYQPLNEMYYIEIETFSVEKGEISHKDAFLTCKTSLEATTPWYKEKTYKKSGTNAGKTYPYTYPYTYSDSMSGEVVVRNDSAMDAYTRIIIYGPARNPVWGVTMGNEKIVEGRVIAEIDDEHVMVVDSNPINLGINEMDLAGNITRNLYGNSDFDTKRFSYIPPGVSKIKVTHSGGTELQFCAEVMEFVG